MLRAITIGYRHDGDPVILAGPEKPLHEQNADFKALAQTREHAEFARVEIWHSASGISKYRRFDAPETEPESEPKTKKKK